MFTVTRAKGPNWDHARGIREQQAWEEHAAFADGLVDRGIVILGGPISSGSDDDVVLLAVNAVVEQEARSIFGWASGAAKSVPYHARRASQYANSAASPKCRTGRSNSRERDRSIQRLDTLQNAEPKASNCF
jgi:hypothetical protein